MSEEEYNGWSNRETWALNLWLSNDEGTYNYVSEAVTDAAKTFEDEAPEWLDWTNDTERAHYCARMAGEVIKGLTEQMFDPDEQLMTPETIITWVGDIGSLYRVDWDEIGAAWLDESGAVGSTDAPAGHSDGTEVSS